MAASVCRFVCVSLTIFVVVSLPSFVSSHGHAHDHAHGDGQPAHFKYSREANAPIDDGHAHDEHGHGHAHNHGHGHAHDHGHGHAHDHGHAHGHGHHHEEDHDQPEQIKKAGIRKSEGLTLWLHAIGSTALISAAPVLILCFIPIHNANERQPLLKVLLAFASGGLLGDAFLHLIPHALMPHDHSEEGHTHSHAHSHGDGEGGHAHMGVGLWVMGGIIAFLCVEKFVRCVKGSHGHSHGPPKKVEPAAEKKDSKGKGDKKAGDKKKDVADKSEEQGEIKVSGYLNLAADFTHNFTDGLAIGASYRAGHAVGVVTTLAVLLHEVPHEIGDFAILIQSGCSKKKAMMLQLTTAAGAMFGTVISLLAEGGVGVAASTWVLPFTAGGFIYIATVSVIPELLQGETKLWQSIKEILALLLGVGMMIIIAAYE